VGVGGVSGLWWSRGGENDDLAWRDSVGE
jgi:hypothetical protein